MALQRRPDVRRLKGQAQGGGHRRRVRPSGLPQTNVQVEAVYIIALQQPPGRYGGVHPAGQTQHHLVPPAHHSRGAEDSVPRVIVFMVCLRSCALK